MAPKYFRKPELEHAILPESIHFLESPKKIQNGVLTHDFVIATCELFRDEELHVANVAGISVEYSPLALHLTEHKAKNPQENLPDFASTVVRGWILGKVAGVSEVMVNGTRSPRIAVAASSIAQHIFDLVDRSPAERVPADQVLDYYDLSKDSSVITPKSGLAKNRPKIKF